MTTQPSRMAAVGQEATFMCGNCGQRFASKRAKRRHKETCAPGAAELQPVTDDERCDDADLYSRYRTPPRIKARADAEWRAMNWKGELPAGWTWSDPVLTDYRRIG